MKDDLLNNIDNPRQLEKMYRENKAGFKRTFNILYPEIKDNKVAAFWNERINYENQEISWGSKKELTFVIITSLVAGIIAKIPDILSLNKEQFYTRNIGFIVFPFLTIYFAWKNNLLQKKIVFIFIAICIAVVSINLLPNKTNSDTLQLACIHLPLFLWVLLGVAFVGNQSRNNVKRIEFLRYNGDLIVITGLILIAGMLLTGITIGLFSLIGFKIEEFYFRYIGIFGLAAAPIIGTFVTQTNPQLVNKVSPLIAKIFSPLVLVTLIFYLIAIIISGKDPYNDREFLLLFNALLIGVMAIILFSLSETSRNSKGQAGILILFLLSAVTVIVNGIAISAILFRIFEWGITPNRLAVLGGNILILTNLWMVTWRLSNVIRKKGEIDQVEKSIAIFLPIYSIWTIIVTFLFPLIFGFK